MAVSALACLPNEAESQNPDAVYSEYETYNGRDLELTVNDSGTHFALWSPKAQQAQVLIYESGRNTPAVDT